MEKKFETNLGSPKNIEKKEEILNVNKIKEGLLLKKEELLKDLEDLLKRDANKVKEESGFPEYGDKLDEKAQEVSDYYSILSIQEVLEKSIKDIDDALDRIKEGSYGFCRYCGKSIGDKRLEARPTASSCITCKEELKKNE